MLFADLDFLLTEYFRYTQASYRGVADVHGQWEAAVHVAMFRTILLPVLPV